MSQKCINYCKKCDFFIENRNILFFVKFFFLKLVVMVINLIQLKVFLYIKLFLYKFLKKLYDMFV